jgi:hypothetical protein
MAEKARQGQALGGARARRRRALFVLFLIGVVTTATVFLVSACNALLGIETGGYGSDGATEGGLAHDGGMFTGDGAPECRGKDYLVDPRHCGGCTHDCLVYFPSTLAVEGRAPTRSIGSSTTAAPSSKTPSSRSS